MTKSHLYFIEGFDGTSKGFDSFWEVIRFVEETGGFSASSLTDVSEQGTEFELVVFGPDPEPKQMKITSLF